ncbi:FadR/GntR family transcriptional regulator [Roseisalinus antarcticus]|nr:FadR/GntR family transcriptional regulator [Roseisalinus antarcticus]
MLVQQLLGFVTAGRLMAGDKLPSERELAERFDVSRPTVREALRALSVLGVLEIRHGGGAFVTALNAAELLGPLTFFLSLSDASVEQLYHARQLIEGEICALAANRVTPAELVRLSNLIDAQEKVRHDAGRYMQLDTEFHMVLGQIADNPFLARASQSLNVLGIEFRKLAAKTKATPTRSISDHKAILAALTAGDVEAARAAMVAHMIQVLTTTRAELELKDG